MKERKIYALGFFDGVHKGHQALLTACVDLAREQRGIPCAMTFDTHPQNLVLGVSPTLINTAYDRRCLLEHFGMAQVETLHFDETTKNMPWQDFFRYLTEDLSAVGLVCGDDFRFGKGGAGNAALLQQVCKQKDIACVVVPQQEEAGVRISSTHIRSLLEQGDVETAKRFLGHPHILSGTVIAGRGLGRTIGIPTANLEIPEGLLLPKTGVYACKAYVKDAVYPAVTNIGTRPTVDGHHITVEPWILDFNGDLYGQTLTLEFLSYLRGEKKFPSLELLTAEIRKNAEKTREIFEKY